MAKSTTARHPYLAKYHPIITSLRMLELLGDYVDLSEINLKREKTQQPVRTLDEIFSFDVLNVLSDGGQMRVHTITARLECNSSEDQVLDLIKNLVKSDLVEQLDQPKSAKKRSDHRKDLYYYRITGAGLEQLHTWEAAGWGVIENPELETYEPEPELPIQTQTIKRSASN